MVPSVEDPDAGSGAFLTPGSWIWHRVFPDPYLGSQTRIFRSSLTVFGQKVLYLLTDNMSFNFVKFVATKKGKTTNFFAFLFCCCCWIRDPGWIKIRIREKHPRSATQVFPDLHGRHIFDCGRTRRCGSGTCVREGAWTWCSAGWRAPPSPPPPPPHRAHPSPPAVLTRRAAFLLQVNQLTLPSNPQGRIKIRLIESNAKCRCLK